MNQARAVRLNLATHPLRNRRLYFLSFGVLALLALLFFGLGGRLYFKYRGANRALRSSIAEAEDGILTEQRQEQALGERIQDEEKENRKRVDLINSLIYRKRFSWIGFLEALEQALPERSFLVSLSPNIVGDGRMEVKFKVACPQLGSLLELVENLEEMGFQNVKTQNEARNESGNLVAEISLTYEYVA